MEVPFKVYHMYIMCIAYVYHMYTICILIVLYIDDIKTLFWEQKRDEPNQEVLNALKEKGVEDYFNRDHYSPNNFTGTIRRSHVAITFGL